MPAQKKEPDYEAAMKQLETIVASMESGEMSVDIMTTELKKAQQLIKMCRDRLTKTDQEIQKILTEGQQA